MKKNVQTELIKYIIDPARLSIPLHPKYQLELVLTHSVSFCQNMLITFCTDYLVVHHPAHVFEVAVIEECRTVELHPWTQLLHTDGADFWKHIAAQTQSIRSKIGKTHRDTVSETHLPISLQENSFKDGVHHALDLCSLLLQLWDDKQMAHESNFCHLAT